MAETKKVIMSQGIDSIQNWNAGADSYQLLPGEIAIVKIVNSSIGKNVYLIKVGDTESDTPIEFSNLPYLTTGAFDLNSGASGDNNEYNPHTGEIYNDYLANSAPGLYSHAQNFNTTASGNYSSSLGYSTIANGEAQVALGKYNILDTTSLVIIGNGSSESRSNIVTIGQNAVNIVGSLNIKLKDSENNVTIQNSNGQDLFKINDSSIIAYKAISMGNGVKGVGNSLITYAQMEDYVGQSGGGGGGGYFKNPIEATLGINKTATSYTEYGIQNISFLQGMGVANKVIIIRGDMIKNHDSSTTDDDNTYLVKRNIVSLIKDIGVTKTDDGNSMIFNNDTENPSKSTGNNNIIGGSGNYAGTKAFEIIGFKYKYGDTNLIYRVSNRDSDGVAVYNNQSELQPIIGKYCTIKIDYNIPHFCSISNVVLDGSKNYIDIYVDKIFTNDSNLDSYVGGAYFIDGSGNVSSKTGWSGSNKNNLFYNTYNLSYAITNRSTLAPKKHMLMVESEIVGGIKSDMSNFGTFIANENVTVFGGDNLVQGDYSLVAGNENVVFGRYSLAIGSGNKVGYASLVVGNYSNIYALNSLSIGSYNSIYYGNPRDDEQQTNGSLIVGANNKVYSAYSAAIGQQLTATHARSLVIGRANSVTYNSSGDINDSGKLLEIGNGELSTGGYIHSAHTLLDIDDDHQYNSINIHQNTEVDAVLSEFESDTSKDAIVTTFDTVDKSITAGPCSYSGPSSRASNDYIEEYNNVPKSNETIVYPGYLRYPIKYDPNNGYNGLTTPHLVILNFTILKNELQDGDNATLHRLFYNKSGDEPGETFGLFVDIKNLEEDKTYTYGFLTCSGLTGSSCESVGVGLKLTASSDPTTPTFKIRYNYMNIYRLKDITQKYNNNVITGEVSEEFPVYYGTQSGIKDLEYRLVDDCEENLLLKYSKGLYTVPSFVQHKILKMKYSNNNYGYYILNDGNGSTDEDEIYIKTKKDSNLQVKNGTIKNLPDPKEDGDAVSFKTLNNIFENKNNYIEFKATFNDSSTKTFKLFGTLVEG